MATPAVPPSLGEHSMLSPLCGYEVIHALIASALITVAFPESPTKGVVPVQDSAPRPIHRPRAYQASTLSPAL